MQSISLKEIIGKKIDSLYLIRLSGCTDSRSDEQVGEVLETTAVVGLYRFSTQAVAVIAKTQRRLFVAVSLVVR